MTNRRHFLKLTAAGSAFIAIGHPLLSSAIRGSQKLKKIGFISGIIGKELDGDWKSILKRTVDYGYSEIETGSYYGSSAKSFLGFCNEIGLKPVAGGIKFSKDMDEVKKSIDEILKLKVSYAISYWPWLVGAPFKLEDCKTSVGLLNKIGEECKKNGLQFCWHNHDNEFIEMEEGKPFDYLMKYTDSDLVKCEMDIYWVKKGGAEPLDILKKYNGRIPILHVKDMASGEEQTFACPGSGIIDFPAIFAEAAKQDIKHYFVERDKIEDGMACLKSAAAYLMGLRF